MKLRITLVILSFLLLAAHFSRADDYIRTILSLLLPFSLFIKKRWILIVIQVLLYCGVFIWIHTIINIASERIELGQPWIRMAIILGVVVLVTGISGILLNSKVIKERYTS